MKKIVIFILLIVSYCNALSALSPIKWTSSVKMIDEQEGIVIIKADIEDGWHLYGMELPKYGPNATEFDFDASVGVTLNGRVIPSVEPIEKNDDIFQMKLKWWDSSVTFMQRFVVTDNEHPKINLEIKYMGCDNKVCLPPSKEKISINIKRK